MYGSLFHNPANQIEGFSVYARIQATESLSSSVEDFRLARQCKTKETQ